jgi:CubicO group peptidase (beta-lactamase class C family)
MNENHEITIHPGPVDISPREAGYRPEKIDRLNALFQGLIREKKLQCASYLLARRGKIFAHNSMGQLRFRGESCDLLPDSIRRTASITKVFTAISILRLIEEGKLYLEQPVKSLIEEFNTDQHKDITLFHLLTHTSGLTADGGYFAEAYPGLWLPGFKPGKTSWIKAALSGPPQAKPGELWNYSSIGYLVLGEVIARVSGLPADKYIQQTVVTPLGLERTFFNVPPELKAQVCTIQEWDEEELTPDENAALRPPPTAGGIASTLKDLWSVGQMLLDRGTFRGERILGRKTVEAMTRNHLTNTPAFYWGIKKKAMEYGLGMNVYSDHIFLSPGAFSHEGAGRSALYIDPVEQLIAVYFVPTTIDWVPESIVNPLAVIWSGLE